MTKKLFVFTVKGVKHSFNTIKELHEARHQLMAQGVTVDAHSIDIEEVEVKASAKIEFGTFTFEDGGRFDGNRVMDVVITVKGADSELVFDRIACEMERELDDYGVEFAHCPDCGEGYYTDSFTIAYSHGEMTQIKNEVKQVFKSIKSTLGIR